MLNILKKIPITEIAAILILNIIMFIIDLLRLAIMINFCIEGDALIIKPDFIMESIIFNFFIVGCYIAVYYDIFTLSGNRQFLRIVCYCREHKNIQLILYTILFLLSPSFICCMIYFSWHNFIFGCYVSMAFPLLALNLYSLLQEKISKYTQKGAVVLNIIGRLIILLLTLLFLGEVFMIFSGLQIIFIDWRLLDLTVLLSTIPVLIREETKTITDWIKRKMLYVFSVILILNSVLIFCIKNEWVTYYTLYLTLLFYLIILLSTPILKLKAKNLALRKEIEEEFKK